MRLIHAISLTIQKLGIASKSITLFSLLTCGVLLLQPAKCASAASPSALPRDQIYTWIGNTEIWNHKLHVTGYRLGCDVGDPQGCVGEAAQAVRNEGIQKIFLSMAMIPGQTPLDALAYSRLSASRPYIVEAGFDDFVDRYQNLFGHKDFDPQAWLLTVLRNIKADNPRLAFGITLYEDEIHSPYLRPPYLPAEVAKNIGYIHLYLHYRMDASHYSEYVKETQQMFPNAKIIAGMYPYDRIHYISCAPDSPHTACTPDQEVQLYESALRTAAKLLKDGRITGIEFYPGFFGKAAAWPGWRNPDYCSPRHVAQCITITRQMRQATASILKAELGG